MIREFWEERKEEKKRQKQLKKENRNLPKTKEQVAYKIFGVIFAIFIVFGSITFSCNRVGNPGEITWDNWAGFSDEMIDALKEPVDRNLIFNENVLSATDWITAQEELSDYNINIVTNGNFDFDLFIQEDNSIHSDVSFSMMSLCAIVYQLIESMGYGSNVELYSFDLFTEDSKLFLKTVFSVDLSAVVTDSGLPIVYLTTTSQLVIHDGSLKSLYPEIAINKIEKKLNDEIVDKINENSYLELSYYTNNHVVSQINSLALAFNATIRNDGSNIIFEPKI